VANRVAAAEKALKEIESVGRNGIAIPGSRVAAGMRRGDRRARYKIQTALALGSDEPAARSALGRLVGSPVPNPMVPADELA